MSLARSSGERISATRKGGSSRGPPAGFGINPEQTSGIRKRVFVTRIRHSTTVQSCLHISVIELTHVPLQKLPIDVFPVSVRKASGEVFFNRNERGRTHKRN